MRRRKFITLLGGAAAAWPLAARAQQPDGMRRIGVLLGGAENDPGSPATTAALREGLAKLGWIEGRNLRIDLRFGAGDPDRIRAHAAELVSLAPDVIIASGGAATRAAQQQTQAVPIVLTAGDAAANGLVRNIARPEGNMTGFSTAEPSIAGKWLGLLKEAVPRLASVAIIFNPEIAATGPNYIASIEAAAPALAVQAVIKTPIHDAVDIVRAIDAFATAQDGGLILLPPPLAGAGLDAVLRLAAQHRLPAIYPDRRNVAAGGLMSYDSDRVDLARRAASYVDRLLRGAKVAELPVQFPAKFELVVNLKTAKALGHTIPESFLVRADEVIE
jgi:putative ABC transport system substrate-binding protein